MEEQQTPLSETPQEVPQGRPRFLAILCILTFIGSGMNFISSIFTYLFFDYFKTAAEALAKSFKFPGMDILINSPPLFFGVSAIIYAGAIAGAVLMWQLKKIGFHVYVIAQIILVIAPMYFFKLPGPGLLDVFMAGLFIILYSLNLKALK